MKKRRVLAAVLAFAVTAASVLIQAPEAMAGGSKPSTSNRKVEMLEEPYGLDTRNPAFSWAMLDTDPDEYQTAYRIVVTDVKGNTVKDTDWVNSSESAGVRAADADYLSDNSLYYWTVQIKDKDGTPSDVSEKQAFTTGLGDTGWTTIDSIWTPDPAQKNIWEENGWTNYAVEMDMKSDTVIGIAFRMQDAANGYFWQIRPSDQKINPHTVINGTASSYGNAASLSGVTTLPKDQYFRVRIEVFGNTAKTYIKLQGEMQFKEVQSCALDNRVKAGTIGFRTGNYESGSVDNIEVYPLDEEGNQTDGTKLYESDFEDGVSYFDKCSVSGGALNVPKGLGSPNCLDASKLYPDADKLTSIGNFVFARDEFQIDNKEQIEKAILSVTAKSPEKTRQYVYTAYMNGAYVGQGPMRFATAADGKGVLYYNNYDVTDLLQNGSNAVGALNYTRDEKAFLCQLTLYNKDGSTTVVTNSGRSEDGWKVMDGTNVFGDTNAGDNTLGTGYFYAARQNIDATKYPFGWTEPDFNDTEWEVPKSKGNIVGSYYLRPYPAENVERHLVTPESVVDKGNGNYFIDLGKEIVGGACLQVDSPDSAQITLRFGEQLSGSDSVKWNMSTGNNYQELWTLKKGSQTLEDTSLMTYRYVEILNSPVAITKENFKGVAKHQAFTEGESDFRSSDDLLNRIYDTMKYSIKMTNQDLYVDSQSRERGAYEGDVLINALSSYSFEDDYALARITNEWLSTHRTWPVEYTLFTIISAWNDYLYTGNIDSLKEYYNILKGEDYKRSLFWGNYDSSVGLLKVNHTNVNQWDSVLVDWPTSEHDGYAFSSSWYNTVMNAVAYGAYVDLANIARAVGADSDAATYQGYADAVKRGMIDKLYNPETGEFRDGLDSGKNPVEHYSQHATAFALAYGVFEDEEMAAKMADSIRADEAIKTSVYGSYFVLDGLYNAGDGRTAYEFMTSTGTRSWKHMIDDLGATISTEAWDPANKPNMTYSHPWGSAPASQLIRGMFGIRPTTAGFGTFDVKFQPGTLGKAQVKIPTVKGTIEASFDQTADQANAISTTVNIPANTKADVYIPDMGQKHNYLHVDGTLMEAERVGSFLKVQLGSGNHSVNLTEIGRAGLELDGNPAVCYTDSTYQLKASYTLKNGETVPDSSVGTAVYTSSVPSVATVNGEGLISPVSAGKTKITAQIPIENVNFPGSDIPVSFTAEAEIELELVDARITDIYIDANDSVYEGGTTAASVKAVRQSGLVEELTDAEIQSGDSSIVTVNGDGTITGVDGQAGKKTSLKAVYGDLLELADEFGADKIKEKQVLYEDNFDEGDKTFGGLSTENGALLADKGKKVFYDNTGAKAWTDYTVTGKFKIKEVAGNIIFRATDLSNYYLWQFSKDTGNLKMHVFKSGLGGEGFLVLGEIPLGDNLKKDDFNDFQIVVQGDTIKTILNGTCVNVMTDNRLPNGSVGVRNGMKESFLLDDLRVVQKQVEVEKEITVRVNLPALTDALQKILKNVPTDLSIYTQETADAVTAAVAKAEELLGRELTDDDKDGLIQAAEGLEQALDGLQLANADKESLQKAVEEAKTLLESGLYTEDSTADLTTAIADAEVLLEKQDQDVTETEIQTAVKALQTAKASLEYKEAQVDELKNAVAEAKAIDRSQYTTEVLMKLDTALREAEEILANVPKADHQAEVDELTEQIRSLLSQIIQPADTAALQAAIERAQGIDRSQYTAETLAAMDQALDDAKGLINANPTEEQQEAVNQAEEALTKAIDNLEKKPSGDLPGEADTSALEAAIAKAKGTDISGYTAQSVQSFRDAWKAAEDLLASKPSSSRQKDVDAAAEALIQAIEDLVVDTSLRHEDNQSGIKVEAAHGVVPAGTMVNIEEIKDHDSLKEIKEKLGNNEDILLIYDISLLSNGVEIQPNGSVKVTIPIPKEMEGKQFLIYHMKDNGELEAVDYELENGSIVFWADSFSKYVVAEKKESSSDSNQNNTSGSSENGSNASVSGAQTGDSTPIYPMLMLMLGAVLFIAVVLCVGVVRRRKRS